MEILGYIIPKSLHKNNFINSLRTQAEEKGELSKKQVEALRDMVEIDEDFYHWDAECNDEKLKDDFDELMKKMVNKLREKYNPLIIDVCEDFRLDNAEYFI